MRVRFTQYASLQIDRALGFISQESPQGADRLRARIQSVTRLLSKHPFAGHPTDQKDVRRIIVATSPYVIFYRVRADEVVVQRFFHTSRDPSNAPGRP